jgi:HEAT repeat protein
VEEESVEQWIAQLKSEDLKIRYSAAIELLKAQRSEAIETIVDYINQRHFGYCNCYDVIDLLADVNDERVIDALIGMLDWAGHVVFNAKRSLLILGTERGVDVVFDTMLSPSHWMGIGTAQLIAEQGETFVPRLLLTSQHENPLMRYRSIYALSLIAERVDDPVITNTLIAALKDGDAKVRERAAWGLSRISTVNAQNELYELLDDEKSVAIWAAGGLYKIGVSREKSLNVVIDSLDYDNWSVQRSAIFMLGELGDYLAVPALVRLLQSEQQRGLRAYAAEALAMLNDKQAIQPLIGSLADEDEMVRAASVKALANLAGSIILPLFVDTLFDTDAGVQQAVIEVWEKHQYHPFKSEKD